MRRLDWGDVPADTMATVLDEERHRWTKQLEWDLGDSLALIERARTDRQLPGIVVRDRASRVAGWSFYLLRNEILEVGAMVGRSASVLRELLDAVFESPEAGLARGLSCFVFPTSPSLGSALTRRHFGVTAFPYLTRDLGAGLRPTSELAHTAIRVRGWTDADAIGSVRLLCSAYAGTTTERCFAPNGELVEWAQYLGQLLGSPGCGTFVPAWSVVAEDRATRAIVGVTIATRVASRTAHIAQVAIDPEFQGRGLGERLVLESAGLARAAASTRLTLLVSEDNAAARALYRRLGFEQTAEFLFASRARPARRASVTAREGAIIPATFGTAREGAVTPANAGVQVRARVVEAYASGLGHPRVSTSDALETAGAMTRR